MDAVGTINPRVNAPTSNCEACPELAEFAAQR